MRKTLLLGALLLGALLTGCENETEVKADEVKTVTETVCEEAIETSEELVEEVYDITHWTEEEFEDAKIFTVSQIEVDYEEGNINEECRNELIELVNALEYDESFNIGYDYEALTKDALRILDKHNFIPEELEGYTIDEIYEMMV